MVKHIIQIGDKRLLKKSSPIQLDKITETQNLELYEDLLDTCDYYENEAAGLSAVQIGTLKRVFAVRRVDLEDETDDIQWKIMINHNITEKSDEISTEWEGCMSINKAEGKLFGPVERPARINVEYYNKSGDKENLEASGFFSHLIQHEIDHLDGILFLKYVEKPENIWQEKKLDKYLKKHRKFPIIK